MQTTQTNLIARDDTMLGVCEAIGEDFGFHPNWLRAGLALGTFWNPILVIGGYVAMGTAVLLTRWLVPNPRSAAPAEVEAPACEAEAADEAVPVPLAA